MSGANTSKLWVVGGVLLGLVLTAVTYLFVVAPARTEVASVQTQIDDATLQQTTLRHKLRDLETASKAMPALRAQLAHAAAVLPATVDSQGLLRRVQTVAADAALTVDSVGIGKSATTDVAGVWSVPVAIELTGSLDGLLAALERLQSDESRLVTVDSGSLSQPVAGSFHLSLATKMYATSPASAADEGAAPGRSPAVAGTATPGGSGATAN